MSAHFSREELIRSATAAALGIDNTPNAEEAASLDRLAEEILEEIRARAIGGRPMKITSGFRCHALNESPQIGSRPTSQHTKGEAADFQVDGMTPDEVCRAILAADPPIPFGQLIEESNAAGAKWTHVSLATPQFQRQVLTIDANGTRFGLG